MFGDLVRGVLKTGGMEFNLPKDALQQLCSSMAETKACSIAVVLNLGP